MLLILFYDKKILITLIFMVFQTLELGNMFVKCEI